MSTYSGRTTDEVTVTSIDPVKHTAWFDNPPPDDFAAALSVGDSILIESKGTTITGWGKDGSWWCRKSDEDLEREHAEFRAGLERRDRERLERNRDDWERRTVALPDWLQPRIRTFINEGGEHFALTGWGYELAVCELAALFEAPDFDDSDAVTTYCREHGVSGNQHGCARSLARAHHEGVSLEGTVAALSPITGDAFYGRRSRD